MNSRAASAGFWATLFRDTPAYRLSTDVRADGDSFAATFFRDSIGWRSGGLQGIRPAGLTRAPRTLAPLTIAAGVFGMLLVAGATLAYVAADHAARPLDIAAVVYSVGLVTVLLTSKATTFNARVRYLAGSVDRSRWRSTVLGRIDQGTATGILFKYLAKNGERRSSVKYRQVERYFGEALGRWGPLSDVSLEGETIVGLRLRDAEMLRSTVRASRLTDCSFTSVAFDDVEFRSATLERVTFIRCNFSGSSFERATLLDVRFINCLFSAGNSFTHASLHGSEVVFEGLAPSDGSVTAVGLRSYADRVIGYDGRRYTSPELDKFDAEKIEAALFGRPWPSESDAFLLLPI